MLDFIEKNAESAEAHACMEKFYSQTLDTFQASNNDRLWLKTNTKLARLWLDQKDYNRLTEKVRELHRKCQRDDGSDDPSKGTYSLEVYALEIQMYAETRNNKRLKVRRWVCVLWLLLLRVRRLCTKERCGSNLPFRTQKSWASFESVEARCT